MASVIPFLPPHLLRSLASAGAPARLPCEERFPAALLFSDISGFTALTERLQAQGRQGAEVVARVVDAAFGPAIRAIERHGGSIACFGGDALFSLFPGPGAVGRALAAAEAAQHAFERPIVVPGSRPVPLHLKQALHFGTVHGLHLGGATRRVHVVAGPAVSALARLEARATDGQVLVSTAARRAAGRTGQPPRAGSRPARPDATMARAYVDPALAPLMGRFEGGFRRLAIMFVESAGADRRKLQLFCVTLLDALAEHGGTLLETDLSTAGVKWMCLFGFPQAHERSEERAALAFVALRERLGGRVKFRAGLHSGVVVALQVGTRTRRNLSVLGDPVNTAARTLGRAAWGEGLVTDAAARALRGVATVPRGTHAMKGKARPVALHAILQAEAPAPRPRHLAPIVGRDQEMASIAELLSAAQLGRGGMLAIQGEAGLGKSRLKWEAARMAREMGFAVHEGRTAAFGGRPYGAIVELVGDVLGLSPTPTTSTLEAALDAKGDAMGLEARDRECLTFPADGVAGSAVAPEVRRINTVVAVRKLLLGSARRRPLLAVLEDLHWADEPTHEIVCDLQRHAPEGRLAVLLLHRPGYEPPCHRLSLTELPADAVAELVAGLLGAVPPGVGQLVADRSGGNPLYVEELVRHLVESGAIEERPGGYRLVRRLATEDVPASIESLLEERLDRLSPATRRIAQLAAVLGRSFRRDHLALLGVSGATVDPALEELEARQLVFPDPSATGRFIFKHALVRDAAYDTILTVARRKLHRSAARGLERSGEEAPPEMLAHHWEQAGHAARARRHYVRAARRALASHALHEAELHLRSVLRLAGADRRVAAEAHNELGDAVLVVVGRYDEASREHEAARAAARDARHRAQEARALQGLARLAHIAGRHDEAEALVREAREIHGRARNRSGEAELLSNLGTILLARGRLEEAEKTMREAAAIQEEIGDRHGLAQTLGNLGIVCGRRAREEEAEALLRRAIDLQHETGDLRNEAKDLLNLALHFGDLGEDAEVRPLFSRSLAAIRQAGDRATESVVLGNLASFLHGRGQSEEALPYLEQALSVAREVDAAQGEAMALANLALVHSSAGRLAEAEAHARQSIGRFAAVSDRRGEALALTILTEVLRSRGGASEEAEASARRAVELIDTVGDPYNEVACRCVLCHVLLARGKDVEPYLGDAARLAAQAGARSPQVTSLVEAVRRAVAEREAPGGPSA